MSAAFDMSVGLTNIYTLMQVQVVLQHLLVIQATFLTRFALPTAMFHVLIMDKLENKLIVMGSNLNKALVELFKI